MLAGSARRVGTLIRQRIIAMRTIFCRYASHWKTKHVSLQIRRTVFQSVISGAVSSGCEPYVFSTMQWKQLESERMNMLRRAFARDAFNHTDGLRTLSVNTLRRRLRFPTLESVTRERRRKWNCDELRSNTLVAFHGHCVLVCALCGAWHWCSGPARCRHGGSPPERVAVQEADLSFPARFQRSDSAQGRDVEEYGPDPVCGDEDADLVEGVHAFGAAEGSWRCSMPSGCGPRSHRTWCRAPLPRHRFW